jgi:hypothetical protein
MIIITAVVVVEVLKASPHRLKHLEKTRYCKLFPKISVITSYKVAVYNGLTFTPSNSSLNLSISSRLSCSLMNIGSRLYVVGKWRVAGW